MGVMERSRKMIFTGVDFGLSQVWQDNVCQRCLKGEEGVAWKLFP